MVEEAPSDGEVGFVKTTPVQLPLASWSRPTGDALIGQQTCHVTQIHRVTRSKRLYLPFSQYSYQNVNLSGEFNEVEAFGRGYSVDGTFNVTRDSTVDFFFLLPP